jgi:cytoskeletal protein CcmA (bactofilin family)
MAMFGSSSRNEPATPATPSPAAGRMERTGDRSTTSPAGNILSSGVSIEGNVTFRTELVIDGEIKGNVTSSGSLTVGEHAHIFGDINVGSVTVKGTVQGNINASERCTLAAGATLHGDIAAPRLAVDENAAFSGSCKITAKRS